MTPGELFMPNSTTETIIDSRGSSRSYWGEVWRYHELVYFFSWRDILVRYKQTIIGAVWAIMRPVLTMVIFTIVFGRLARLPSDVPYPILVYAALLPWQFFATALVERSNSIIENANLLTKVYFPRLIVPISSTIVGLIDFVIAFMVLLGMMGWYRFLPSWRILCLPTFAILAFLAAL